MNKSIWIDTVVGPIEIQIADIDDMLTALEQCTEYLENVRDGEPGFDLID